jgi:hypothetical protein
MTNEETKRVIQTPRSSLNRCHRQPPKKEGDPQHRWREPISGLLGVIIPLVDIWYFGKHKGLPAPLDELFMSVANI